MQCTAVPFLRASYVEVGYQENRRHKHVNKHGTEAKTHMGMQPTLPTLHDTQKSHVSALACGRSGTDSSKRRTLLSETVDAGEEALTCAIA
jgi:hypothetical protein